MSRADRINRELRHHISIIIQQELKDPNIGFVTVTSVSISPDLSQASVYFTCMGDDKEKDKTKKVLNRASGYIRKLLGKRIYIKFIPDIKFIYDDTLKQEQEIDRIFDDIHKKRKSNEQV